MAADVLRALVAGLLLIVVGCWAGCGGKSAGYLPVDSPIMEFEPPDAEELVGEDEADGEESRDADEEDGDWFDDMESEDSSDVGASGQKGSTVEKKGKRPKSGAGGNK